jgi:hypothetical protein
LRGDKLPVLVEGGAVPTATPAIANASGTPNAQSTRPTAAPGPRHSLSTDGSRGWGQTFIPVFQRPVFWATQAIPFLGLIGFLAGKCESAVLEIARYNESPRGSTKRPSWSASCGARTIHQTNISPVRSVWCS